MRSSPLCGMISKAPARKATASYFDLKSRRAEFGWLCGGMLRPVLRGLAGPGR
jgi:hypothetical protein